MATHENCMNEVMQKAFEMGGLEDGSYHLEDDELEYLIQLALSQQTEPAQRLRNDIGANICSRRVALKLSVKSF